MAVLSSLAALCSCTDDSDDGKPSVLTRVLLDAGLTDAETDLDPDGGSLTLSLTCRRAVVTERTLDGFTVSLRDPYGPVAGAFVALSPSTGTIVSGQAGGDVTNANGEIHFSYTAPHFDNDTTIALDANTRNAAGKTVASGHCSFLVATSGLSFTAPAANTAVKYAQTQSVELDVAAADIPGTCATGGGIQIGSQGVSRVMFAASATDTPSASICLETPSVDAPLTFWVRGSNSGGTAHIQASAGTYLASLQLQVIGAPSVITMKSDSPDLSIQSAANLTLSVQDDVGQAVAGVSVSLTITRCADGACLDGESVAPPRVMTDAMGSGAAAYFSGTASGAAQINAALTDNPAVTTSTVLRVH